MAYAAASVAARCAGIGRPASRSASVNSDHAPVIRSSGVPAVSRRRRSDRRIAITVPAAATSTSSTDPDAPPATTTPPGPPPDCAASTGAPDEDALSDGAGGSDGGDGGLVGFGVKSSSTGRGFLLRGIGSNGTQPSPSNSTSGQAIASPPVTVPPPAGASKPTTTRLGSPVSRASTANDAANCSDVPTCPP